MPSRPESPPTRLAIVIPAWKARFLAQAVDSILGQSGDGVRLCIGDDASGEDLRAALGTRLEDPRVRYHRFPENIGRTDLVAHWERCIDLAGDAGWIWLFSDDDLMGPGCVEAVLGEIGPECAADLLRFPVSCIDEAGTVVRDFPTRGISGPREFIRMRLRNEIDSFVVEYVFRREAFLSKGRFQPFDLAWGADDATWMKLMEDRPPRLLPAGRVFWRRSRLNISPNERDEPLAMRKIRARMDFLEWLGNRYPWFRGERGFRGAARRWFFRNMEVRALSCASLSGISREACARMGWRRPAGSAAMLVLRKWMDSVGNGPGGRRRRSDPPISG